MNAETLRKAKAISSELETIDRDIEVLNWAIHRMTRELLAERKYFFRTTNGPDMIKINISDEDIQLLIDRRIERKKILMDELERL